MYTIAEGMANIYADPTTAIIGALLTYFNGFVVYGATLYMQVKNKTCPMALWQHAWYFGHDLTFSLLFHQWFVEIGFWLFEVLCIGCIFFVFIELFAMYRIVKYERQELFGKYYNGRTVSEKQAWIRCIIFYLIGLMSFSICRLLIGDPLCLFLMMTTNAMMAIAPTFRMEEIGRSQKGAKLLSIFTVLTVIVTFLPQGIGWFATVVTALHQPAFYILGVICLAFSFRFVYQAFTYPKQQYAKDGSLLDGPAIWDRQMKA